MSNSAQNSNDWNPYWNADNKGQAQNVPVGNEDFIGKWTRS